MKRRPLVMLDFDGTLVDSLPSITHATRRTFALHGLREPTREEVRTALLDGRGLEYYLMRLNPELPAEEVPAWIAEWRAVYAAEAHPLTRLFPGTRAALARLREAGAALVLMSNKGETALKAAVAGLGLADFFALVAGQTPDLPKKPDPTVFHALIAPALPDHDPERMLMAGDSEADLLFGRAVGARCCFAAYGYGDPSVCSPLADTVITDVAELPLP
ncbi:phosphoglycolate phosphatase [Desulfovibrio sp. X2]|uniref:HAD family hydrolase n=1 Tax=Desulfovibrio sp. X2 TaxID=941449 RepID=UPI0003588500|nr:HAD family hydrolase [Desulfovibrio sp. X2]EPR41583.1 phosphoglycolate phosphatase [Desulfovibrio sp. X2]